MLVRPKRSDALTTPQLPYPHIPIVCDGQEMLAGVVEDEPADPVLVAILQNTVIRPRRGRKRGNLICLGTRGSLGCAGIARSVLPRA